jgi:ABC-type sugar transport system permease subunit
MSAPRPLRDWAVVAPLALIVLLAGFVQHRNKTFVREQAAHAAAAVRVDPAQPLLAPAGDTTERFIVSTAPSPHPLVERRTWRRVDEPASAARPLGGPDADPDLQALYDLARAPGAAATLDPLGRGLAARALPDGNVVVARTAAGSPAPLPALPLLGVLVAAAALVLVSRRFGREVSAGALAAGGLGLAALGLSWGVAPWSWATIAALALAAGVLHHRGASDRFAAGVQAHRVALAFITPTALAMVVLVLVPFGVGLGMGFFDHHHGTWTFVGLGNFGEILSGGGRALSDPLNFWFVLGVTLLWTFANVLLHVLVGVALAVLLTRPWLRGRGVLRMLLILPWAIPNYITALIWKGMFAGEYGAINRLLEALGLDAVGWFSSWSTAFAANVATNTWMGFPFMMVIAIGVIEGIPRDLYEAAAVDGASRWQAFRLVTLPHLRVGMAPAVALGTIWTFNMFNVIFLVSAGKPGGSTNILVTDAYRWAFERGERYGMAAAYATLIFIILLGWTAWNGRRQRRRALGAA